jgi:hypothetical protein
MDGPIGIRRAEPASAAQHSCIRKNAPRRLTSCTGRSFRYVMSRRSPRPWRAPRRWRRACRRADPGFHRIERRRTPSTFETIVRHVNRPGHPRKRLGTVVVSLGSDISAMRQPAPCSACAIPRPMPCCPPVMSAVPVTPQPRTGFDPGQDRWATRKRLRRDRQRRVHRRRGGKNARIGDPEVLVVMRATPGRHHACRGVGPHPGRAALMRRRSCDRTPSTGRRETRRASAQLSARHQRLMRRPVRPRPVQHDVLPLQRDAAVRVGQVFGHDVEVDRMTEMTFASALGSPVCAARIGPETRPRSCTLPSGSPFGPPVEYQSLR